MLFGMGIDKSDVRLVIHLDLPDSIEALLPRQGRAGRRCTKLTQYCYTKEHDRTRLMKRIPDTFSGQGCHTGCVRTHLLLLPDGHGETVTT